MPKKMTDFECQTLLCKLKKGHKKKNLKGPFLPKVYPKITQKHGVIEKQYYYQ